MTEIIKYLARQEPKTSSNAPYTLGVKKTKSKLSWGTDSVDAGSSTGICKKSNSVAIAYQSRWYDRKTDKPYTIEIDGSMIYQRFSNRDRTLVARLKEDRDRNIFIEWAVAMSGDNSILMDRIVQYLAIGVENPTHSQAIRRTLPTATHCLNDVAVKRKVVKVSNDGSVDLSFAEWQGNKEMHLKNRRPKKAKRDRIKNAIKMY
jgi:hypothetical protein